MELFITLGLLSLVTLVGLGAIAVLRQRRDGTVLAVSVPTRNLVARPARHTSQRRASSAHR